MVPVTVWVLWAEMRCPREVSAIIERKPRGDWAVLANGRRFLIGTTAFLTEKAAWQRWQGNLDLVRKSSYIRFKFPHRADQAARLCQVDAYSTRRTK